VQVLAKIVKLYHDNSIALISGKYPHLAISPWHWPTTAGYVHAVFLRHLHEGVDVTGMDSDVLQDYTQSTWAALEAEEYYFAKLALRGGRTDIRQYYYQGEIRYKDIQSHYPHVQLDQKNDYPVGTPTIHICDNDYWPCNRHFQHPDEKCVCKLSVKRLFQRKKLTIIAREDDGIEFIKTFFGICLVDVTPPTNLYHPVLVYFDKSKFKCMADLKPIVKQAFTSVELHRAIEMGYVVTKVYRADSYNRSKSKWTGLLGDMYLAKMRNSSAPPPLEDQIEMKRTFKEKYDIDLGDMNTWAKNPVLKMTAKQPITSAWGKHAETVDHPKNHLTNDSDPDREFFESVENNHHKINEFVHMSDNRTLFKYTESRLHTRPNLHKGYVPIAVFVPSYARLYLWEEMNKLGKRVLMHDTDSIIYTADGEYDIEEGKCLGDWETEDFQKDNGGIVEFVAIGPKSYGLRAGNGKETFKCKGVSIKLAGEKILNFTIAKELLMRGHKIYIPQFTMDYTKGYGITTRKFLKKVQFNQQHVKGDYREDEFRSYPYGYIE
jgi:hypothetical protein